MKCSHCNAEVGEGKYCQFCGSSITYEMKREQEQLNKKGCPQCGSSNVAFERETQGQIVRKDGTAVIRETVGLCKDCGHTWRTSVNRGTDALTADIDDGGKKKRKTWLWVLGWIFIFPVPTTILLLRYQKLEPKIRYALIAAAWIVYLLIGYAR